LVIPRKRFPASRAWHVECADGLVPGAKRDAKEGPHVGVAFGPAGEHLMGSHVIEAARALVAHKVAQQAAANRRSAAHASGLVTHGRGDQALDEALVAEG